MVVLITGNMGYVGPVVVTHLSRTFPDAALVGIDAGYFAHCLTGVRQLPERVLDRQVFRDIRTVEPEAFAGVDAVVHLAAISNDPIGHAFERATFEVNHEASVRVAKLARDAGVGSFVFASSCSVYGSAGTGQCSESTETAPLTAYAKTKLLAEESLRELADDGFTVTALRFATACGMSDRLRLDLVLNDFVAGAVALGKVVLLSDGTPWRPLIHVRDMARAMEWAVDRRAENGGAFLAINAGSNSWNYRIGDLAAAVAEIVPEAEVEFAADAAPDRRSYQVDFSLFEELAPLHQPRVDLEEAISELWSALRGMSFRDPDYRESSMVRLTVLRRLVAEGMVDTGLRWADHVLPGAAR